MGQNTNVSVCTSISCFESMCDNLIHWAKQKRNKFNFLFDLVAVTHPQNDLAVISKIQGNGG